jgi:hypothetical protein
MDEGNSNSEGVKPENRESDEKSEETGEDGEEFDDGGDTTAKVSELESSPETLAVRSSSDLQPRIVTSADSVSEVAVEHKLQLKELKSHIEVSDRQITPFVSPDPSLIPNSSESRGGPALRIVRTPSSDGYNWRKYGQKQVKVPQGYRSYYKCTYSQCYAKKIECCDDRHVVIEVKYKGQHNHEPPRKMNHGRESGPALASSSSFKEPKEEIQEMKRQDLSLLKCNNAQIVVTEQHADDAEPKKRVKKSSSECVEDLLKPDKKPKLVVHAAGDVGISGDGYRWRKYGQKMVKGNPHPRNYYRCTSAGCPVRKHIERAVDSDSAVIITYKGKHDHDTPVPKKRHGPPSPRLVAASAAAAMNTDTHLQPSTEVAATTQWSVDMEGELTSQALDLGGEKAIESARTLLSIGFEIKPC